MSERLYILDTTLRDGKQAPGVEFTFEQELETARRLDEVGVDGIEAGTPITSEAEFAKVKAIADEIRRPAIFALARGGSELDIETALKAVDGAREPWLHVFYSSSDIHQEYQLGVGRDQAIEEAVKGIERVSRYCNVQFSPMDATRTDRFYLYLFVKEAIDAGAKIINIPDTVGWAFPDEYADLIRNILDKRNVSNIDKAIVSVHCHNDLEMAVANTISGVQAGARKVETTINGIGERAGNAALASVVMAIYIRNQYLQNKVDVGHINTKLLGPISWFMSEVTGWPIPFDMPMIGENAFAHESGIHADGVKKDPRNYEIVDPNVVSWKGERFRVGQTSGRNGFQEVLKKLGYEMEGTVLQTTFKAFQELNAQGKANEKDLRELAERVLAGDLNKSNNLLDNIRSLWINLWR